MKAIRFPGRDDAMRRLCLTEPALCAGGTRQSLDPFASGGAAARRAQFPAGWVLLWVLLALSLFIVPAKAQDVRDARGGVAVYAARVPASSSVKSPPAVESVAAVGMTVSDMDVSVDFYTKVLTFEKVSDTEVAGEEYEQLEGVFGLRMRVVRLKLGDETLELTEYLAPKGKPVPADSRSNDLWFQHVAIITSDMDRAYQRLRENKVQRDPDGHAILLFGAAAESANK